MANKMNSIIRNKETKLYIYNTSTSSKEIFKPIVDNNVLMYVCGITAYDLSHIGHARCYITFDVIYRYLAYMGFDVTYVRNFTDVDDKIINKANEENIDIKTVSEKYIKEFHGDMDSLGVLTPTVEPRATETIKEMIGLIEKLIKTGHAYEKNGDVFFRVESFKEYGKLSHKNLEELMSGARIPVNEEKENMFDFALWKRSRENEPFWESPWGNGRPGWHIECSAMSMKFLGESIDIHGGGSDLIFPHHENEIAQTESLTGKNFVNYWIHNGFVNINNEKMSKSLKNFVTVRDMLSRYNPEVIRLFFMFTHYRSYIDFSYEGLDSAKTSLNRLYQFLKLYETVKTGIDSGSINKVLKKDDVYSASNADKFTREFEQGMNDDFNTPVSLSVIFNLVRIVNKIMNDAVSCGYIGNGEYEFLDAAVRSVKFLSGEILGILKENPEDFIKGSLERSSKTAFSETEIISYIEKRNEYRRLKNYAKADEIRKMLSDNGVLLEDSAQGTSFKLV